MKYVAQQQITAPASIPSPTGGLDVMSPLARMAPDTAVRMVNAFADTTAVKLRRGFRYQVKGLGLPVDTIMDYNAADGTTKIFAATSAAIYDVTTPSATAPTPEATTVTSGRFAQVNFANTGGSYLVICNGADPVKVYDGTVWHELVTEVVPLAVYDITGPQSENLIGVTAHKSRLWFIESGSLTAWYGAVDAIAGAFSPFYLGGVCKKGGQLIFVSTWTVDTGSGDDDKLVFVTSEGEVLVYAGTDPDDSTLWGLVGVYDVAKPLGNRVFTSYGGDLVLLLASGVISLATILQSTAITRETIISYKVSRLISSLSRRPTDRSWEMVSLAPVEMLIINVPASGSAGALQLVMNIYTGAWSMFEGLPATTWRAVDGVAYMGTSTGEVTIYGNSVLDGVEIDGSGGTPIVADIVSAFSDVSAAVVQKRAVLARPLFVGDAPPAYRLKVNTDYHLAGVPGSVISTGGGGNALWDIDLWDEGLWGVENAVSQLWVTVNALGHVMSCAIKFTANADTGWVATDLVLENGNIV